MRVGMAMALADEAAAADMMQKQRRRREGAAATNRGCSTCEKDATRASECTERRQIPKSNQSEQAEWDEKGEEQKKKRQLQQPSSHSSSEEAGQ